MLGLACEAHPIAPSLLAERLDPVDDLVRHAAMLRFYALECGEHDLAFGTIVRRVGHGRALSVLLVMRAAELTQMRFPNR